jgi:hypothetical protein
MNKNDYIHLFEEACGGKCNAEYNPCIFRQAADSLAALKPVAWVTTEQFASTAHNVIRVTLHQEVNGIPLYAMEVTK